MKRFIKNIVSFVNPEFSDRYWKPRYYYWQPKKRKIQYNFGDDLVKIITLKLSKNNSEEIFCKEDYPGTKILCGGSTLHFARDNDMVWGAGVRDFDQNHNFKNLDIASVRGPLTAEFLLLKKIKCPDIFGDPAILLPRLFPELTINPEYDFGYVPHYTEICLHKDLAGMKIITPDQPGLSAVKDILKCKAIISSSLHGLIVADAFNIPCVFINENNCQPLYKYKDYFLSIQRDFKFARSISEAKDLLAQWSPPLMPDMEKLISSFPKITR
jgi:pyruvyltransferase